MEIPVWEVSIGANHVLEWHIVNIKQEPVCFSYRKLTFKGFNMHVNNMYRSDVQTCFVLQYIADLSGVKKLINMRHKQNKWVLIISI